MGKIKISELSNANQYNRNDVLLVSRRDSSSSQTEYITFNYKIDDFRKEISSDVQQSLYNALTSITASINDVYDSRYDSLSEIVNDHIEDCATEHDELCGYLETLSNNLCADLTVFKSAVCLSIDAISSAIDVKFNEISQIISTDHKQHVDAISALIDNLSNYITANYVTLNTEQTITGRKTFIQDIIGTAMSARWA